MNKHARSNTLKLAVGGVAVLAMFALRGLAPELYRYFRIRRM